MVQTALRKKVVVGANGISVYTSFSVCFRDELSQECLEAVKLINIIINAPMEDNVYPWESLGMTLQMESCSRESDEDELRQESQEREDSNESRSDSVVSRIRRSFRLCKKARGSSGGADKSPKTGSKAQASKWPESHDGQSTSQSSSSSPPPMQPSSSSSPQPSTSKSSSLPSSPQNVQTDGKRFRTKFLPLLLTKKRTVTGNRPVPAIEDDRTSNAMVAVAQTAAAVVTCIGAGSGRKSRDSNKE